METKEVTKEFTRESNKQLLMLMEKMKSIIGGWAIDNDYHMEFRINIISPIKTLGVTLTERKQDVQENISIIHETACSRQESRIG